MDVYGVSAPDLFRIDDLLDFSNDQIFSTNNTNPDSSSHQYHHQPHSHNSSSAATATYYDNLLPNSSDDFTDNLYVPVSTLTLLINSTPKYVFFIYSIHLKVEGNPGNNC